MKKKNVKQIIAIIGIGILTMVQPISANASAIPNEKSSQKMASEVHKDGANSDGEQVTPSGIDYKDLPTEIDRFIEERKEGCASVSLAVFQQEDTLYETQYGYANLEAKEKVDENTVYEWGSVSKLMVWVSVMQLYEKNALSLTCDIREYLPDGFLKKISYKEPITMLDLMNHTAGWQETTYDVEVKEHSKIIDLEQALRETEPPQIYKPGTVTAYSNWSTALAAFIVQRVSGEDYVTYVQQNILKPLGMEHTSISIDCSDNQWVMEQRKHLTCYSITQESYENYGEDIRYILLYPSGSVTGTRNDFLTFAKALVPAEGEDCVLFQNKETLALMKQPTSFYGDSDIPRNCHGIWTLQYTVDIMGHSGNTNGCSSILMFEPNSGLGVVVMTNESSETAFNYGVLSLIFGDYSNSERVKKAGTTASKDLSGIYTSCRSFEKGFSRIYKYMGSLLPLSKTKEQDVYKLTIGQGTLTKVAEHQYIMDNENGWRYLMYETENDTGTTTLQMYTADVVKENTITFGLKVGSLVIFLLFVFLSILLILIRVGKTLFQMIGWKKHHKEEGKVKECNSDELNMKQSKKPKQTKQPKQKTMDTLLVLSNIVIGIIFYNLILCPLDNGSVQCIPVVIQCSILMVLIVMTIVLTIYKVYCCKKEQITMRKTLLRIRIALMSCYICGFLIYWQMFNFWSC
ncbi:serine hydrolase domain-containing protein [Anaerosporobacter faecicola]|uniref:serine hydrolase domain-containing protein n=1 Tax=Anaerosporobacter faecicola TaxID=2718714 RepID=UPI001438A67D|nr:serine hydrolase domain-containing protein [Anaerosporobacter faecicola]